MEDEEKSHSGVKSSMTELEAVSKEAPPLPQATDVCCSSPAPVNPEPTVHTSKPNATSSSDDCASKCDKDEPNNAVLNVCLQASGSAAPQTDAVDVSQEDPVTKKCQEPLPVSSSESCDNPKTDSETDQAVDKVCQPKNAALETGHCPDISQGSSKKGDTSDEGLDSQLAEKRSKDNSKPENILDRQTSGTELNQSSLLTESNESSVKSQENDKGDTLVPQEKSHDEESGTADIPAIQREKAVVCSNEKDSNSRTLPFSGSAGIDESSNMSLETAPSIAHADPDQVNIEESMDVTNACEESDPFLCSKDTENHDEATMDVDEDKNPVAVELQSEKDVSKDSSVSDSVIKSSGDKELPSKNIVLDQERSAARAEDDAMEVDDSSSKSEDASHIVSEKVDKESANVMCSDMEDIEENSSDKEVRPEKDATSPEPPSEKDPASPDPDQTITGDRTSEVRMPSEEISSSLAGQQKTQKTPCDNASAALEDSSESPSSSSTEKNSNKQSGTGDMDIDTHENTETGEPKSKQKVGIHLVSTSSLVSRQDTSFQAADGVTPENSTTNDENEPTEESSEISCAECGKMAKCKYKIPKAMGHIFLCEDECYTKYRKANDPPQPRAIRARKLDQTYEHKCGHCSDLVDMKHEKTLTWETMDFCDEHCLEKCQRATGSNCANCKKYVQSLSLGKYCVRFGYDMKQFCSAPCLEEFKKGLKVCSYCQKDISRGEGFLAPVGDKGAFKDFCTQDCMEKYEQMSTNAVPPEVTHECAVCNEVKAVKVEILLESKLQKLCSEPCFAAFKFVNDIVADKCDMCKKYYDRDRSENFSVFYDDGPHSFCCKTCMNVYILAKRKIVPCSFCKVKKYNFDMIKKTMGQNSIMLCSLHCLESYQASPTAAAPSKPAPARKIGVKKSGLISAPAEKEKSGSKSRAMPVISSVTSLAPNAGRLSPTSFDSPAAPVTAQSSAATSKSTESVKTKTVYKQQFILRPPPHPEMSNCAVQVKPLTVTQGVSCQPEVCEASTQTDDSLHESLQKTVLVPIPVPIYIPMPMHMYSVPYPVPVPIPIPIPVPFFIPTTRNSAKGIFKEIKRIQENVPSDPFEAELLMMAEMVAGEKKGENTDTESDDGGNNADDGNANEADQASEPDFSPVHQDATDDDVLQMALKMASDFDEPALEGNVGPTSVVQSKQLKRSRAAEGKDESEGEDIDHSTNSGKKAVKRPSSRSSSVSSKRMRTSSEKEESIEKPDANMCLKFSLGVNAWKNWVIRKNTELEKSSPNKARLFKPELLQLTADELNYTLCLFVKEAQDPNGCQYTPDTIYYLCLGIQQYLMENGRVDNIFCDPYYEKFTDCLDDAIKRFSPLQTNSENLVTRIQEEHLWESKQLGAFSPFVLLNTLVYFNTRHFDLSTVEEHMQLSFSHIMKHWKRNATSPNSKALGAKSNNILLRFYPPQSVLAANSKKKKVYEQQENETDPLRCPVKLYEFYLSKCPESVKTRNDVFYLLPERSCVPDSPVWYSTMSLDDIHLKKMLNRIKVVREILDIGT